LNFPNLLWAVSRFGTQYQLAAAIGCSESWLSRRLVGRVAISDSEREAIARTLGYSADWLFRDPEPPVPHCISEESGRDCPKHAR
jgi:transcriptional regulator with XRE-family HTH domain